MVKNSEKYIKETGCEWTNTAQLPQNRWIPEGCTCEHDKEYLGSIFTSIEELLTSPQWLRSTKSVCQSVSQSVLLWWCCRLRKFPSLLKHFMSASRNSRFN